jgi:HlyD family secretion protein
MSSGGGGQEGKDFKVVLRIQSPPPSLRPGMSCEADIETAVRKDVMVIPLQALTVREVRVDAEGRYLPGPAEEKEGPRAAVADSPPRLRKELQGVFVCAPESQALFRPVKTGITGETDVEVLEGLVEREEVVVGPLKALRTLEDRNVIKVDREKPFRRFLHRRDRAGQSGDEEK